MPTQNHRLDHEPQVSPLLFTTNPFNRLAASADSIVGGAGALPTFACPATTNQADQFMASGDDHKLEEGGDGMAEQPADRLAVMDASELEHDEFEN